MMSAIVYINIIYNYFYKKLSWKNFELKNLWLLKVLSA